MKKAQSYPPEVDTEAQRKDRERYIIEEILSDSP
jgi:hypothetical protein